MAIYHFSAKVIARSAGRSAVAAAAYRSASRLYDERTERPCDYTRKSGVLHSEIMAPAHAPDRWQDRQALWNEVEWGEKRKDAQLAREIEFALPREMHSDDAIELARSFVQREFVARGMVADLNVHCDVGEDGLPRPHAHVMLAMREVKTDGFGAKVRDWNSTALLEHWREAWADHVNERLAQLDLDIRIDHRSLHDQGIGLEPQPKIGPAAARLEARGRASERVQDHRAVARRNGDLIIRDPAHALETLTHNQASFSRHDLARFVFARTDGKDQFDRAMGAILSSRALVRLGEDERGRERFTSADMVRAEQTLIRAADGLAGSSHHPVSERAIGAAARVTQHSDQPFTEDQVLAVSHVLQSDGLSAVVGYAGTGKSAMLGAARLAWEAQGYRVRGAALSGIAAESLEKGSGIASRTLASLEYAWERDRDRLSTNDVLVIDEAGMAGTRQMARILKEVMLSGAKVVLAGDPEQLQAIEAGAPFRKVVERHGAAEITQVLRQRTDWQRQATRELATGRTAEALARYEQAGAVTGHDTRTEARQSLVAEWADDRRSNPAASRMMMAYTRADVAELNRLARAALMEGGALGEDQVVETTRGPVAFAAGDRVMFLRNERSLGVKNGTLGTLVRISGSELEVRLDDARTLRFDCKDYADLTHGYAATIHKVQGATFDKAYVLASSHIDLHAAYVAMSRHRDGVSLRYGRDEFPETTELAQVLGRSRSTSDRVVERHKERGSIR